MEKKDIAFVVNSVPPIKNTTRYQHCLTLCKRFNTSVYSSGKVCNEAEEKAKKSYNSSPNGSIIKIFYHNLLLFILVVKENPDLLITGPDPPHLLIGYLCSKITKADWIIDFWDDPSLPYSNYKYESGIINKFYEKFFYGLFILSKLLLPRSQLVILSMHRGILSKYNTSKTQIVCLTNGCTNSVFDVENRNSSRLSGEIKIVYAGSVNRSRNIIKFLNGLSNQTDRKVHIHIIGSAPKPVISQLNYQQKDIKIIFHGECEWDNTIEAISESDICILPLNPNVKNYNYSYPIKLFEYLSVGGAVLATSTVGIKQIVTDSKTAMISDDIDTINKRFNLLLKKPEIRRKMSENGTDISRDYMWEDITNEYIVCIENHLDSHKNA